MNEHRKVILGLIRSILLEELEHKDVNVRNVMDLYQKLIPVLHNDANLRSGLEFVKTNIQDYGTDDFVKTTIDSFIKDANAYVAQNRPNFFDQFDRGYSGNKFVGSHYDHVRGLPIKEVAKLVREELKILFPDWKFSIRSSHNHIYIDIMDLPYNPCSPEYDAALKSDQVFRPDHYQKYYTEQYEKDVKKIKGVMDQYNMDDSDIMSDYHHSHFYSNVSLSDREMMRKWYPQNAEFQRMEKWHADYDEKTKAANALAAARRGKYKKGTEIIFTYDKTSANGIPKGEYEGVVLKSPNGQGMMAYYSIKFTVNKKFDAAGNVVDREKPGVYTTSTEEKNIRPK